MTTKETKKKTVMPTTALQEFADWLALDKDKPRRGYKTMSTKAVFVISRTNLSL